MSFRWSGVFQSRRHRQGRSRCLRPLWAGWWPHEHHLGNADLLDVIIEPRVGGRWYECTADGAECDWGRVLFWEPPRRLVLAWHLKPTWDGVDPDRASTVEITFEAVGGGTDVQLQHRDLDHHGDQWRQMFDGVAGPNGWGSILDSYRNAVSMDS